MSKSPKKNAYFFNQELRESQLEDLEHKEKTIEDKKAQKDKIAKKKSLIEKKVLKILKKGKITSKLDLTDLLIQNGIDDYSCRFNIGMNQLKPHIPELGGVLKQLRMQKKVKFSIENGSHVFFIEKQKPIKVENDQQEFDWKNYQIPRGENQVDIIFKIPGNEINIHHFLASCFPIAKFDGFYVAVTKKYEKNPSFQIFKNVLTGFFEEDKLVLQCNCSENDIEHTVFTLAQIGRKIIIETIKLSFKYSEVMRITNYYNTLFIPLSVVFREKKRSSFYQSKYHNTFRYIYDFPEEYKSKEIFGSKSVIAQMPKEEDYDIHNYFKFADEAFKSQTKMFLSAAISKDWIINPNKATSYVEPDDELEQLIDQYLQDIDTDRLINERLEETMEKSEFFKETTSNLLLTLLSLSLLADSNTLQWIVVGLLLLINVYYIVQRRKKSKRREF